ncbi:hypothetical protein GZH46_02438 [Fragariocoptes setiger]|uniref:MARVEL domain-containing protein n=1 Tax=Fragariocoptes setiger TaxID=1670756 RepID=A0ABQ7S6J5_9ACAR|nr:hypothetical protein GZH46_02438 [Fragariocoptes setiger]
MVVPTTAESSRDFDADSMAHVWPRTRPDSVTRIHPIQRADSFTSSRLTTTNTTTTTTSSSSATSFDVPADCRSPHVNVAPQRQRVHPTTKTAASPSRRSQRRHSTMSLSSAASSLPSHHEQLQHQESQKTIRNNSSANIDEHNRRYSSSSNGSLSEPVNHERGRPTNYRQGATLPVSDVPVEGTIPLPRAEDVSHTRYVDSKPHVTRHTTTKASTAWAIPDEAELNCGHYRRWPGWLKLCQLLVAIVCYVVLIPLAWFAIITSVVVSVFFAVTMLICIFYLFTLSRVVMPTWPWLTIEYFFTCLASALYVVSAILMLVMSNQTEYEISLREFDNYFSYMLVAILALVNAALYAGGAYWIRKRLRRREQQKLSSVTTMTSAKPTGNTLKQPKQYKKPPSSSKQQQQQQTNTRTKRAAINNV